jgi:hypothetical protein
MSMSGCNSSSAQPQEAMCMLALLDLHSAVLLDTSLHCVWYWKVAAA